ncbi:hypothetical protein EVAR_86551_1 [Eumeta japonica]|uniref:Craniofacial development protein 2 n=1 Tax=Eumeta variegata TaxID=151549 RepID=A0A4C1ZKA3_EUMVA|nr:hypothetical protein EVAR_86551_1 [Eumeta japonica]
MDDKIDDVCELMIDRRLDILCVDKTKLKGVYGPDISKPLEETEEFWADVRDILVKCDRNERIVILGDFNGGMDVQRDGYEKVGDERVNKNELDELWKVTKSVLVDEAKKVCGVNKRTNVSKKDNEWWNYKVRKVVSEKKKVWLDLLSEKTKHRVQRKDILKDKLQYAESMNKDAKNES